MDTKAQRHKEIRLVPLRLSGKKNKMKSLYHFFRLIRPLNLVVIALTMFVFQYFLIHNDQTVNRFDFILFVFSTILIASAGNIINDYFDVKADRVNKPDQLIIDRHVKRRVAILMNWIFNSIALFIAFYISWKYSNWLIFLISFASVNLLWLYSVYFKRIFIVGNIIVAALTGVIPLYVLVFYNFLPSQNYFWTELLIFIFSAFAFWLNLIREIVKDLADVKGDLLLYSKTLPIVLGFKKTKIILVFFYVIAILPILLYLITSFHVLSESKDLNYCIFYLFIFGVLFAIVWSMLILIINSAREKYIFASNLLKLAMLFGLLTPLFL